MVGFTDKKMLAAYKQFSDILKKFSIRMYDASLIEQYTILEEMYEFVKEIAPIFYKNGKYYSFYKKLLDIVIEAEGAYKGGNISFDGSIYNFFDASDLYSVDNLLDFIATKIRKDLIEEYKAYIRKHYQVNNPDITIDQIRLGNMCEDVSNMVLEECKKLGVRCRVVRIDPGFNNKKMLYHGSGYHYFNIITYKGFEYLMDLTYSQFFDNDTDNILDRLGMPLLVPCQPGIYMLTDDERVKTAEMILKRGWVPFTEENIKNYFDGFALSVRNGLYYEENGGVDYHTPYTYLDYIHFLEGEDDMFKHESREHLGRQIRPLKDPYINFKVK